MAQAAANNNDHPTRPVKKSQIEQFFTRLRDANPAPTTELHYATPFQLLIAVILVLAVYVDRLYQQRRPY